MYQFICKFSNETIVTVSEIGDHESKPLALLVIPTIFLVQIVTIKLQSLEHRLFTMADFESLGNSSDSSRNQRNQILMDI